MGQPDYNWGLKNTLLLKRWHGAGGEQIRGVILSQSPGVAWVVAGKWARFMLSERARSV